MRWFIAFSIVIVSTLWGCGSRTLDSAALAFSLGEQDQAPTTWNRSMNRSIGSLYEEITTRTLQLGRGITLNQISATANPEPIPASFPPRAEGFPYRETHIFQVLQVSEDAHFTYQISLNRLDAQTTAIAYRKTPRGPGIRPREAGWKSFYYLRPIPPTPKENAAPLIFRHLLEVTELEGTIDTTRTYLIGYELDRPTSSGQILYQETWIERPDAPSQLAVAAETNRLEWAHQGFYRWLPKP